ncbi:MAG TPA: hypothetical protein VK171_10455, partial [Fimbriimonas sp.]|nr:hypothetical protein [Fimbriimonas sp.]
MPDALSHLAFEVIITMNLGRSFRGLTIGLALVGASVANAQQLSMWWNLSGDSATTQRSTLDVLANSSVTLSVYMGTTGFSDAI